MGVINIFKLQEDAIGLLGVWNLTESSNSLSVRFSFTEKERNQFHTIKNEKRKREFLAVRLLLQEMMQQKMEIIYNEAGKPSIEGKLNISIAHSSQLAVILLTEKPSGIDVENISRDTDTIASRFLSEQEANHVFVTNNPAFTRILYWCAKEAVYKVSQMNGVEFKNHIFINPFEPESESGKFTGQLLINKHLTNFVFNYFLLDSNAIVYCIGI